MGLSFQGCSVSNGSKIKAKDAYGNLFGLNDTLSVSPNGCFIRIGIQFQYAAHLDRDRTKG